MTELDIAKALREIEERLNALEQKVNFVVLPKPASHHDFCTCQKCRPESSAFLLYGAPAYTHG